MFAFVESVKKLDLITFQWCMQRKHSADIAAISRWISRLGDGYGYLLLALLLIALEVHHSEELLITALIAFTIELPLYLLFKNTIRRNRPAAAIGGFNAFLAPADKFSFPSGHTAAAFLMATLISTFYPEYTLLGYSIAALIGSSRVLLGVHFPTDIIAGIVLGIGSAMLAPSLQRLF